VQYTRQMRAHGGGKNDQFGRCRVRQPLAPREPLVQRPGLDE
jgi:hypothetical protein